MGWTVPYEGVFHSMAHNAGIRINMALWYAVVFLILLFNSFTDKVWYSNLMNYFGKQTVQKIGTMQHGTAGARPQGIDPTGHKHIAHWRA